MAYTSVRRRVQIGLAGTTVVLLCLACAQKTPPEQMMVETTVPEPTALGLESPLQLPTQTAPTPSPLPSPATPEKILHYSLDRHRLQTAMEAFGVAQEAALAWQKGVLWYGVMPSTSLERALALPMAKPGWVFRFGATDSAKEYVVHVVEGELAGKMELQIPEYIEPSLADLNSLDARWEGLLDSLAVLEDYTAQKNNILTKFPNMDLDYRLVYPKACDHPLWILFDAKHLVEPLFVADAMTGESVTDVSCTELWN